MLTAGDEFGRTQNGNNNAYAQDNATTWLDWAAADEELASFTARLAAFRKRHPSLSANAFLTGATIDESGIRDAVWLKPGGSEMTTGDWNADARVVGLARYMPASPAVAADRTVVWINGGSSPALAWLPPPRSGFAWAVASTARGPRSTAAKRSLETIHWRHARSSCSRNCRLYPRDHHATANNRQRTNVPPSP